MSITSWGQLEKELQSAMQDGMKDVAKKGEDIVKQNIDRVVYFAYSPSVYSRTRQLWSSITSKEVKSNGNSAEVEIYHDTSKISSSSPNQHMSVISGSSSASSIPEIVHDGKSGLLFGTGVWTSKRPYMDTALKEMEGTKMPLNELRRALRRQGFRIY